jgi:hypothetical protein
MLELQNLTLELLGSNIVPLHSVVLLYTSSVLWASSPLKVAPHRSMVPPEVARAFSRSGRRPESSFSKDCANKKRHS